MHLLCCRIRSPAVPARPLHFKKRLAIFPSLAGMSLIKLSLAGNNKLFPAIESLVSDIPASDGKIANLFLQCMYVLKPS
jgi:hypothetical protein